MQCIALTSRSTEAPVIPVTHKLSCSAPNLMAPRAQHVTKSAHLSPKSSFSHDLPLPLANCSSINTRQTALKPLPHRMPTRFGIWWLLLVGMTSTLLVLRLTPKHQVGIHLYRYIYIFLNIFFYRFIYKVSYHLFLSLKFIFRFIVLVFP